MELQNVSIAFISRFHFQYSPHSTDRKWCLFAIRKIAFVLFATLTKQFLLADEVFYQKTHLTQQHGIIHREFCIYLTQISIYLIFINHLIQQTGSDVCLRFKSYLSDTNETTFASRWRVFIKKTQITQQHGITEREYCVYLTFSFSLSTSFNRQEKMFVCDSKDNKSYLRDTNKTIFASRWRVFIKKNQITEQHGITEREDCVYLTFSFSLFTSFNRQEVMFVCDSKDNKSYLRDTNKTIFASRWRVFIKKKPNNWAAWNYRTWGLRLSHVFIFIIHLIQQTGGDVCFRFKR